MPLALGIFLVWYSLSKISIPTLLQYFKEANYKWVFLALIFGFLSHFSRAYRWKFMLEPLGFKPKIYNSLMAVFAAYLTNYGIPRSGEVMRAAIFTNYENVPFEKGFGTIVAERIADLLMMLIIVLLTLFLQYDYISGLLLQKFNPKTIIIGLIALILLGAVFFAIIAKSKAGISFKIKTFVLGIIEGATSIFKMKKKWAFVGHTLFIWLMYLLMFYTTTFAISGLINIPLAAILVGFIAGGFSIAATNGGIGSYPEAIVIAFLLFNIDEDPSRAFGWIMWTAQTALIIFFGAVSFLLLPIINKQK